jgi:hypothetical protein
MNLNTTQLESVSPFKPNFLAYIDPKLRKSIQNLVEKGYLPTYSCEGHTFRKYRHIDLAFGERKQLEAFVLSTRKFRSRLWITCEPFETTIFEVIDGKLKIWQSLEDEINGFNKNFLRNYEKYFFLRIYIGKKAPDYSDPQHETFFEQLKLDLQEKYAVIYNFLFREIATKIFERDIRDRCAPLIS